MARTAVRGNIQGAAWLRLRSEHACTHHLGRCGDFPDRLRFDDFRCRYRLPESADPHHHLVSRGHRHGHARAHRRHQAGGGAGAARRDRHQDGGRRQHRARDRRKVGTRWLHAHHRRCGDVHQCQHLRRQGGRSTPRLRAGRQAGHLARHHRVQPGVAHRHHRRPGRASAARAGQARLFDAGRRHADARRRRVARRCRRTSSCCMFPMPVRGN